MKKINLHDQFGVGHRFALAGIAVVCAFLVVRTAFFAPPSYVEDRAYAALLFIAPVVSALVAMTVPRRMRAYTFLLDGLPYLLFPAALIAAGNDNIGMYVILAIAVVANIGFLIANGRGDSYTEGDDIISIYFRWPF